MSATPVTETAKPDGSVAERKLPIIRPENVIIHDAGQAYKTLVVTAPDDLTVSDLNDSPTIWKLIQASRGGKALTEWDRVEIRFRDCLVTAKCNHATHESVTLFDIKRASKPMRDVQLFEDDKYAVRWRPGGGYGILRKKDQAWMTSGSWPTPESAKAELFRMLYQPQPSTGQVIG